MNMFEQASRLALRFPSTKGPLTVEQLWDLPLTKENGPSLNSVAQDCNRRIKEQGEENFVETQSKASAELQLQFDIVRHIIAVRKEENAAKLNAANVRQQLAELDELIAAKQQDSLKELSVDELVRRRAELANKL